jgi:hypothetical protein
MITGTSMPSPCKGHGQRLCARQRLFQQQRAAVQPLQRGRGAQPLPERGQDVGVGKTLVAVERDAGVGRAAVQQRRDALQPLQVVVGPAAELELEVRQPAGGDGLLQRGRQAVLRVGAGVAVEQPVGQADGVAQGHVLRRGDVQAAAPGVAQHAGTQAVAPAQAQRTQHGVCHGLVQLRGAELRRQPRQAQRAGLAQHLVTGVQRQHVRRRLTAGVAPAGGRQAQRAAQLLEVLLVRQRRVLVEPLGHHQLGTGSHAALAVDVDLHPHEGLRRLRDGGSAKTERQPQRHRAAGTAAPGARGRWRVHDRACQAPRT